MKIFLPSFYRKYRELWGNEAEMLIMQRKIIKSKPILQLLYENFYKEMERFMSKDGLNVEIGTGHGYSRTYFKNLIITDRVFTPHIEICNDAQSLPFRDNTLDTIMMIGVLHHMKTPDKFFDEARRVLKKEGKIVMIEPYVSFFSYPVYRFLHHEGCNLKSKSCDSEKYHLLDANIAIPTIFFKKERKQFEKNYRDLKIVYESYHTVFHFFASGSYKYPSLLPKFLLPTLLKVEKNLQPLGKWIGSLMTIVVQKN